MGISLLALPFSIHAAIRLNPEFAENGSVISARYALASENKRVVYVADPGALGIFELFSVPVNGGEPIKLSGNLTVGGNVGQVEVTSDGKHAVFVADKDVDGKFELYSVPTAGGLITKLTTFADDRDVNDFALTPSGTRVVYISDELVDEKRELFSIGVDGTNPVHINGPFADDRDIFTFVISPNGSRVIYRANQDIDTSTELFSVVTTGGGLAKLNPNFVANRDVLDMVIDNAGSNVVYRADQDTDGQFELYAVPIAGGVVNKVNPPVAGSVNNGYQISPDGSKVVYRADQNTIGVIELFVAPITGGGAFTQLNTALVAGGNVSSVLISPDGKFVVYRADQDVDNQTELYSRALDVVLATPIKLNPPLANIGSDVNGQVAISANSQFVIYHADQDILGEDEIYRVPIQGGTAIQLNDPLVATGTVFDFRLNQTRPNADQLIYIANQDFANRVELYAVGFDPLSDFDGDNKNDILFKRGKTLSFLTRNSSNQFEVKNIITPLLGRQKVNTANDLNGDKRPDIVLRRAGQQSVIAVQKDLNSELSKVELPTLEPKFRFKASNRVNGEQLLVAAKGLRKLRLFLGTNVVAHTNATPMEVVGFGDYQGLPSMILKSGRTLFAQSLNINGNQVTVGEPINLGKLPKPFIPKATGSFLSVNDNVEVVATKGKKVHIFPLPVDTNSLGIPIFTNNIPINVVGPR
jgi:Tol biopolymer transport system component